MRTVLHLAIGALALGALLSGCSKSAPESAAAEDSTAASANAAALTESAAGDAGGGSVRESDRTREMEAQREQMDRTMEQAQSGELTPEEAWAQYERERAELNQMADGAPPSDETIVDDPPPPLEN